MPATFLRYRSRTTGLWKEDCWDNGGRRIGRRGYYGGSYFRTLTGGDLIGKITQSCGVPGVPAWNYPNYVHAVGTPDSYGQPSTVNPALFDASSYGAEAWNRMRPDRPEMDLLTALFEARKVPADLSPRILKYRNTSAWADYHLAIQFGWLPTLNDAKEFVHTLISAKDRIDQLIRDEGRPVERRWTKFSPSGSLKDKENAKSFRVLGRSYAAFNSGVVTQTWAGVPFFEDTRTMYTHQWAKAVFRYHLPPGPKAIKWRSKMLFSLFGLDPTPQHVWQAIPFSWLADWFTNATEILQNIDYSVADSLAADYAFLMQRKVSMLSRRSHGTLKLYNGGTVNISGESLRGFTSKERTIIDPFGPSVTGNLNPRQASILGAIGLTSLPSTRGGYRMY